MNYEFRRVYSRGKSAATKRLVVYCRKNGMNKNRLGITVSTKLGKAVVRNRAKRRFREIFRLNSPALLPGHDFIIVARTACTTAEYSDLNRDFLYLAKKLGVLREDSK